MTRFWRAKLWCVQKVASLVHNKLLVCRATMKFTGQTTNITIPFWTIIYYCSIDEAQIETLANLNPPLIWKIISSNINNKYNSKIHPWNHSAEFTSVRRRRRRRRRAPTCVPSSVSRGVCARCADRQHHQQRQRPRVQSSTAWHGPAHLQRTVVKNGAVGKRTRTKTKK